MPIVVRPLRLDDPTDVAAAHSVLAAARRHDVPDFPEYRPADLIGRVRYPWPGMPEVFSVAEADGQVVGTLIVQVPSLDNLHLAEVEVQVHPAWRRRGVARTLVDSAIELAREQARSTLVAEYVEALPGGDPRDPCHGAFAAAMGFEPALPETRRRLDLATAPDPSVLRAEAERHAGGYTPIAWAGPVPAEYRDDVARLESRLLLDAPMGDLDVEPENHDGDRIRANDEMATRRGRQMYVAAIRHDATGQLVAHSAIGLDAGATRHAWQQITLVDPAHRGHRLGILVKLANLDNARAHEADLRYIDTWNARENAHMIAINEAIGFRAVDNWVTCQRKL